MQPRYVIHLVPSTHWDREWYLPFRRFQVRLVRLMDKVIKLLESGKDPYFVLDGQTVMLEDYLEAKPWMKERVHQLIQSGKLVVGPWYTVPDTFIPSGESLWKNLEIGADITKAYGGAGQVGYSPDSFGITGQLPQIYAHFGKKYAMYTRGQRFEKETAEQFGAEKFTASDGTSLLSEYGFYSLGLPLVQPSIWKHIDRHQLTRESVEAFAEELLNRFDKDAFPYRTRMLMCGIDHIEPRENFPYVLEILQTAYPDVEWKGSTQDLYFEELEKELQGMDGSEMLEAKGEQRGNYQEHFVLGNTLSSRMDIKRQNRRAENLLFSYLSGLDLYEKPQKDFDFLDRDALIALAQKELIRCHSHDAICTCSVDETCADIKNRLEGVWQIGQEVLKDDLLKIGASLNGHGEKGAILVYNCLPFQRSVMVEGKLVIPYKAEGNCISDGENILEDSQAQVLFHKRADLESLKYVSFEELEKDTTRTVIIDKDAGPEDILTGLSYRFMAEDVPAMGFKLFYLKSREEAAEPVPPPTPSNVIENDCLQLTVNQDGTLDLLDKKKGAKLAGIHRMECCADEGDEYTYSNPKDLRVYAEKAAVLSKSCLPNRSSIQVEYEIPVPGGEPGQLRAVSTFSLKKGSDLLEVKTNIWNHTENFRLRVLFSAPGVPETAYSDTAFDLTARPVYHKDQLGIKNILTMPCRNLVSVPAEGFDLTIYSGFSQEFETVRTDQGSVTALTLLRSVGKVYGMELLTRNETAMGNGTRWFTEDGKMKGLTTASYAVKMAEQGREAAAVCNDALSYQLPLLCWGVAPQGDREAPGGFSLEGAVLSRIEKKDGATIARVYNPSGEERKAVFSFANGKRLETVLGPKKIANLEISSYIK